MITTSKQGDYTMFDTCVLHDDYEDFAQKFLQIDYEDYVNMELGLTDEDVEYSSVELDEILSFV